jgi:hypothetical protein
MAVTQRRRLSIDTENLAALAPHTFLPQPLSHHLGIEAAEHLLDQVQAEHDAGCLLGDEGHRPGARGYGGLRGHVAGAQVLSQGLGDDLAAHERGHQRSICGEIRLHLRRGRGQARGGVIEEA